MLINWLSTYVRVDWQIYVDNLTVQSEWLTALPYSLGDLSNLLAESVREDHINRKYFILGASDWMDAIQDSGHIILCKPDSENE